MKQKKFMEIEGVKVKCRCQEHVDATCKDVETTLSLVIKDMKGQLPGLVQKFEGEVTESLHMYRVCLTTWMMF